MEALEVQRTREGLTIRLRVSPKASRDKVGGVHDGALRVAVTAPPVDGAANAAIVKLLAKALGVGKGALSIVRGQSGRDKLLAVAGLEPEELGQRLGVEVRARAPG